MQVEGLREIVVGAHGDFLSHHVFLAELGIGEQHEPDLVERDAHLDLVAKLAAGHAGQILLADNEVGHDAVEVAVGSLGTGIGSQIVDAAQARHHELVHVLVVVDEEHFER